MLTMNLDKGGYKAISGKQVISVTYEDTKLLCGRYHYTPPYKLQDERPPIADAYEQLLKAGGTPEQIIKILIDIYADFKYIRVKEFANLPLVVGFIGPRGSGKTAGAVNVLVLDWLIRGKPVWSNVDIAVRVCYRDAEKIFKTIPFGKLDLFGMDNMGEGGAAFVDEINMTAAEGSRYMSSANLEFAYALQQIRKKKMSVIWTCQGFNWVDSRTRWQTDFVIACRDGFISGVNGSPAPGWKSKVAAHDLSGMTGTYDFDYEIKHKYVTDFKYFDGVIYNRPIWDAYDTELLQGEDNYIATYKDDQKLKDSAKRLALANEREQPIRDLVEEMAKVGQVAFYADEFWEKNGITDKSTMTKYGQVLSKYFNRRRDGTGRYYYERKNGADDDLPEVITTPGLQGA